MHTLATDGAPRYMPGTSTAPPVTSEVHPDDLPGLSRPDLKGWRATLDAIRYAEGERGIAERKALALRWVTKAAILILSLVAIEWSFSGTRWESATTLMAAGITTITVTATVGTIVMANQRKTILDQFNHFLFSLCVIPGAVIAVFSRMLRGWSQNPANSDSFTELLSGSLPYVYAFGVFMTAVIFVKTVAGMRTITRASLDDQEAIGLWSRHDGYFT